MSKKVIKSKKDATKKNIHHGSDFREYLDKKGILKECEAAALCQERRKNA